jgi:hypothetical protein
MPALTQPEGTLTESAPDLFSLLSALLVAVQLVVARDSASLVEDVRNALDLTAIPGGGTAQTALPHPK